MKKYYYVSFEWRYRTAIGNFIDGIVVDVHPLDWVYDTNKRNLDDKRYTIISWQEIGEAEFKLYQYDF